MQRPLEGRCSGRRVALGALAVLFGVLWWWAVLRLVLAPEGAGPVEGVVAAGGWGLSLLPVHVAGRVGSVGERGRQVRRVRRARATRAWRRRRSGGGSGPS
ncbi:hypothetical protein GCM10010329_29150 [Streptomyces spiroverticillatus]|uniref:Uncharacterized protein n=1 Tax=Streptomyces finlayi TaxID=67296 RepID=A0A918WVY9_9ACTN|nr:hypothetical protein [Streptomyces finlayi]GHA04664.1 hypothetical protein GCM10010329_29150 [Streptomyces spiroverticillatus]GHC88674.1 hypothetical protein GCM10010334_21560 [Streptomyces finlayi]